MNSGASATGEQIQLQAFVRIALILTTKDVYLLQIKLDLICRQQHRDMLSSYILDYLILANDLSCHSENETTKRKTK